MFICLGYFYFYYVFDSSYNLLFTADNLHYLAGVPVVADFVKFCYGKLQHSL